MAITFIEEPNTYSLSDNPINYLFSSNQTAQPNFSFIVRTYYNSTLVSTDKVFPEVGTRAHWDASNVIQNVADNPILLGGLHQDNQMVKSIKISVSESYGTTPAEYNTTDSTTTYTFKGRVNDILFQSLDLDTDYKGQKWLTNSSTNTREIMRGVDVYLSMLVDSSQDVTIKFYDSSNSLLHTYTDTQNYKIWQLNLNTNNLITLAGVPDISLVSYFTVQIGTSEVFTFTYRAKDCYTAHQLLWLNCWGVPDQFVFGHNNILKGSSKYLSYKKAYGEWRGSSFVYDASTSGVRHFNVEVERSGVLVSSWLSQADQNFITEIYESPYHLLIDSLGTVSTIDIKDSSYEWKQDKYEELFNEEIEYNITNSFNSFRL